MVMCSACLVVAPRDGKARLYELCTFYREVTLHMQSDKRIAIWPKDAPWSTKTGATWPVGDYFLFHERCWQYLIKCFGQEFIGLEKLYDALRMPPPPKGEYMSHTVLAELTVDN
ncbi:hypothetical protein ASPVEDRAFT_396922 [Aspergillus versicolor CBS 583.65]|uniref:Uncharacterized protein n=1 Tax=Aspergillus versicolor CBS 583.65 TaxID=1036611 RepID=A0A1L9Q3T9_ASPVE|nr:uncharacterized protein ASPVEDRAFT_396922 [Aspergillus versicolor CBS 583.65]OJJ08427.1 hypothetical protein ASPVEDRAFT_396922 [Aspergillus versicolor CBS 583.65]